MSKNTQTITITTQQIRGFIIEAPADAESELMTKGTDGQLDFGLSEYSQNEEQAANEKENSLLPEKQAAEDIVRVVDVSKKQSPPWELVDPNGKAKAVPLPMTPDLYEKMFWLTQNLGKMSFQKLALAGTTRYVDELIGKHYRAE